MASDSESNMDREIILADFQVGSSFPHVTITKLATYLV